MALSKALEDRFRRLTAVTPSSVNIDAVLGEDQKENVQELFLNSDFHTLAVVDVNDMLGGQELLPNISHTYSGSIRLFWRYGCSVRTDPPTHP